MRFEPTSDFMIHADLSHFLNSITWISHRVDIRVIIFQSRGVHVVLYGNNGMVGLLEMGFYKILVVFLNEVDFRVPIHLPELLPMRQLLIIITKIILSLLCRPWIR